MNAPASLPTLRFLTCGSVDDGKSTLIGRLLHEQNQIFEDQLSALAKDSLKHGTTGEDIDFALLVDGLEAEREQGITIDVAYRYFSTPRRSFIVADTPGHEQYTRNMVTGASNADLAILLVDARKGLLTLADEIDIARDDVLCRPDAPPAIGEQFAASVIWMGEEPMHPGRSNQLKIGPTPAPVVFVELHHRLNVATLEKLAAKSLGLNEVALCELAASHQIAFDPYTTNHAIGGFIVIDRATNATVAAGVIAYHLRRSENVHFQQHAVSKDERAAQRRQTPKVVWFTGLSGAGKSTIANLVDARLHMRGAHSMILDGDNVRHGLNRDLGFTEDDRIESIRRVGEVAKLMTEAGLIVLCSFISPFAADRRMVRELLAPGEFVEVHVHAPIDVAIERDPKGLYKKALAGKIKNFTGVDQPYEAPVAPELTFDTTRETAAALADRVVAYPEARVAVAPALGRWDAGHRAAWETIWRTRRGDTGDLLPFRPACRLHPMASARRGQPDRGDAWRGACRADRLSRGSPQELGRPRRPAGSDLLGHSRGEAVAGRRHRRRPDRDRP